MPRARSPIAAGMRPAPNRIRITTSTISQCDRLKVPDGGSWRRTHMPQPCHASSGALWSATVRRLDFRLVGRLLCVQCHGAALEDRPRCAAGHDCATRASTGWWAAGRSSGDLTGGSPVSSRPARAATVCRASPVGRSPARRPIVCSRCRRARRRSLGRRRAQRPALEGSKGRAGRSEDQDDGEPRCQPRLQPLTSMRPRTHRHPGSPPAATGGRPIAAPVGGRRAWSRPGAASSSMNRGSGRACPPIGALAATRRSAASRCDSPLRRLRVYSP